MSWSLSRACAVCSRSSNAIRSRWVSCRNRDRFRPRVRASESSSSSLSRSKQLRTPFEKPRMEHLLKTTRSNVPLWRTKSKHYFSPYVRPGSSHFPARKELPPGWPRYSSSNEVDFQEFQGVPDDLAGTLIGIDDIEPVSSGREIHHFHHRVLSQGY